MTLSKVSEPGDPLELQNGVFGQRSCCRYNPPHGWQAMLLNIRIFDHINTDRWHQMKDCDL